MRKTHAYLAHRYVKFYAIFLASNKFSSNSFQTHQSLAQNPNSEYVLKYDINMCLWKEQKEPQTGTAINSSLIMALMRIKVRSRKGHKNLNNFDTDKSKIS